jgi:hypothetical protein
MTTMGRRARGVAGAEMASGLAAMALLAVMTASCCRRDEVTADPSPPAAASNGEGAARKAPPPVGPLASAPAAPPSVVAPHPVWLMHHEQGYFAAELGRGDERWASEPPVLIGGEAGVPAMRRTVDPARAPAAARAIVGRPVSIVALEGGRCGGRAKGLSLMRELYSAPNERLSAALKRLPPEARTSSPRAASLAASAWKTDTDGWLLLVAEVELDADCSGMWAQPASAPETRQVSFDEARPPLAEAALRALKGLPIYAKIQARYAKMKKPDEPAHWSQLTDYSEGVQVAKDVAGQTIVHTAAMACRGYDRFTANLEVFWLVSGTEDAPQLKLYGDALPSQERWVTAAADINHDGKVDVLTQDGYALGSDKGLGEFEQSRGREIYTCPGAGAASGGYK